MTTKPYVSGSAYLHRMGDFCESCTFDPAVDCPVTPLYWAFLARNERVLRGNQRLRMPLASVARRGAPDRRRDEAVRTAVLEALGTGEPCSPDRMPAAVARAETPARGRPRAPRRGR